jgi:hypothetical protein
MKRTTKMTLAYFMFMLSCVLGIICVVLSLSLFVRVCVVILVCGSATSVLTLSRCPYCGKFGVPIKPFLKQNLCCKKCGKQVH